MGIDIRWAAVKRDHVLRAMADYTAMGQDNFLAHYKFKPAKWLYVEHGGELFDSKAILGVAHGFATGTLLTNSDFPGGEQAVNRLDAVGFLVDRKVGKQSPLLDLTRLPTQRTGGRSYPYQHVVLMDEIARVASGGDRLMRFSERVGHLRPRLRPFGVRSSAPDPQNPTYALKVTLWREIVSNTPVERWKQMREVDPLIGLTDAMYQRMASQPDYRESAVSVLIRAAGPAAKEVMALADELGLSHHVEGPAYRDPSAPLVYDIDLESSNAETFETDHSGRGQEERERVEAALQREYINFLRAQNQKPRGKAIRLPGSGGTLKVDVYNTATREIVEVKGDTTRKHLRMALGQVLDYESLMEAGGFPSTPAVLLPEKPPEDFTKLFLRQKVSVIWRSEDGFERLDAK